MTFTNLSKSSAPTWTRPSKTSSTFTPVTKSGQIVTITAGTPIGLLLTLTYASTQSGSGILWTNINKS